MFETWWHFFGRFHPVLVHFPIALLIVGAGLKLRAAVRRRPDEAGSTLLLLGAVGAVLASVAGLAFAAGSGFRGSALAAVETHRNVGLAATALAVTVVVVDRWRGGRRWVVLLAVGMAAAVGYAGHLGGVSVYGAEHFTLGGEQAAPVAAPAVMPSTPVAPASGVPVAGAIDFLRDVQPIFEQRCYRCHDGRQRKGGLRLDRKKYFVEGGDGGPAVVAGKPMASKLFQMINLPEDHEDYMPAKGDPIPAVEVDVIGRWIEQGAARPDEVE
jgi:uncharacterized membrane protein